MVSNKRAKIILIFIRPILFAFTIVLAASSSRPLRDSIEQIFGYQNPPGFFIPSLADWGLAFAIAILFWGSILFGGIGRKTDYFIAAVFFIFSLWTFVYTDNVTPLMYIGLVGMALLANAIGYALKLFRLKWLKK